MARRAQGPGNIISLIVLIAVCVGAFLLAAPAISDNINDPNMIAYFNADEGGLMDIAWWYYSGQRRDTFQWDFDYGLEMRYLADTARLLSKWIDFTPGTFVLILRWLHLFSWIAALIALWYFVGYHFGRGWQQSVAVLLLATRPSFGYFICNLKPEPLVLLLMIIGLHYSLKIIREPSWKNLLIAVALASLAFITKFAGGFLLTAIVLAMYLSKFRDPGINPARAAYPTLKWFWALPAIMGLLMMALPVLILTFYVRKSTGTTWAHEYGIWGSLLRNKIGISAVSAGLCGIALSAALRLFAGVKNGMVRKIMDLIKELSSYALVVFGIFAAFVAIFGFRWILAPKLFITTYAFLGTSGPATASILMIPEKGFLYAFLHNMAAQIKEFDATMILLFVVYLGTEAYFCIKGTALQTDRVKALKRFVLLGFLVPAFGCIFSMMRIVAHHMLPFFVALSVLSLQGIDMLLSSLRRKRLYFYSASAIFAALLLSDIGANGTALIKECVYRFNQNEDIAYDVARWWHDNMPKNAAVVAEEYTRSYIPAEHKNIILFKSYFRNRNEILRELVLKHRPEFVYYNAGTRIAGEEMPPMQEIVPEFKFEEVASFDSSKKRFEKLRGARFVIYKVVYK